MSRPLLEEDCADKAKGITRDVIPKFMLLFLGGHRTPYLFAAEILLTVV